MGRSGVQLEGGGGVGHHHHHQTPRRPPRTHNSIIHSPSSNEVQFSSVRTRTLLRRPRAPGTAQSNRTRAAKGTGRRPKCAMSAACLASARSRPTSPPQLHFRFGGRSAHAHESARRASPTPPLPATQCACPGPDSPAGGGGGKREVRLFQCARLKRILPIVVTLKSARKGR